MDLGITGKKVLVTGASRGLGCEIAKLFAQEGCNVGVIARDESALKKVVTELEGDGHAYYAADLLEIKQLEDALGYLEKNVGEFDIIINNLGGSLGRYNVLSPKNDWLEMWNFNVGVAIEINNRLIPKMQAKAWGRVVHVSSISGRHLRGNPPYALTKSCLTDYAKILGRAVAKDGVIVSSVLPGAFVFQGSYWDQAGKEEPEKLRDFLNHYQNIGRLGTPKEIAAFVVFLASAQATFAAGADVPIDGGSV